MTHNQQYHVVDAAEDDGSLGRLINHSRLHPNIKPTIWVDSENKLRVLMKTTEAIAPGRELLFDYGSGYTEKVEDCVAGCHKCAKK